MTLPSPLWPAGAALLIALAGGCEPDETAPVPSRSPEPAPEPSATEQAAQSAPQGALTFEDPGAEEAEPVKYATAVLQPTKGSQVRGTVHFRQSGQPGDERLQVSADVSGLPPGKHAYHVHLYGDCSGDDAKTAGTHFNFGGSSKEPGDVKRITGNLGELETGPDGRARAAHEVEGPTLQGRYSILGRSVVVHEKGNDPSQPPIGAAGGRLSCGTIGIAGQSPDDQHARMGE